jgi:imidazolonepropionase-like amidohydrolase
MIIINYSDKQKTIFKNAAFIDGFGDFFENGWLSIEGSKIDSVGFNGEPLPNSSQNPETKVIDLSGHTVLPGLIDTHVHITATGAPDLAHQMLSESPSISALKAANNLANTLKAGFTTVRDLGGRNYVNLQVRDAIEEGLIPGSRVLSSGHVICITGGHGHFMGLESDGPYGVKYSVRKELKAGADLIKFISTGGVLTKGVDPMRYQFDFEEIQAGIIEAHKAGKKTSTHAQGTQGIAFAVKAGIDSVEHGYFLNEKIVEEMLKNDTFLVLTITSLTNIIDTGCKGGIPIWAVDKAKAVMEFAQKSHAMARKAGVKIAMGTDSGTPYNYHGANADELVKMVESGFTPMEALVAATTRAAELMGLNESLASLTPGKLADLLVVAGNPLDDISILTQPDCIESVFKAGIKIDL